MNIHKVILSEGAKRDLKKLPSHILIKLYEWIEMVSYDGLMLARKIPGFHDEPLKGKRKGQRSIRLNKSYRAIYEINPAKEIKFVEIIEVNKHEY